jgi:tRNA(Arg) A34 adenosine deaminase TadA
VSAPGEALAAIDLPIRRCLELAYDALRAGGLACGSVLVGSSGEIIAEGRNHAYDPPTGSEILEGSPIAHAELNALARVATDRDLGADTLWSSQEPCSMCTAAAAFVGVGAIAYVAPDPWALASNRSRIQHAVVPTNGDGPPVSGPAAEPWRTIANVLFIVSIAATRGPDHATVARSRALDPVAAESALALLAGAPPWPPTLAGLLERVWDRLPTTG